MKKKVSFFVFTAAFVSILCSCNLDIPVLSKYIASRPVSVLSFKADEGSTDTGDLYIGAVNCEQEKVAGNVLKNEYLSMPYSEKLLYMDAERNLFLKDGKNARTKIADNVVRSSFGYNSAEDTIAYIKQSSELSADLCVWYPDGKKETLSSNMSTFGTRETFAFSYDSKSIYFLDQYATLFKKNRTAEPQAIGEAVTMFKVSGSSDAYTYMDVQERYFIKWADSDSAEEIQAVSFGDVQVSENGFFSVYTCDYDFRSESGNLYILLRGDNKIKIASGIRSFKLSADSKYLYYMDGGNTVYVMPLPSIDAKTCTNPEKFNSEMGKIQPKRLCDNVSEYKISRDGLSSIFIDADDDLYVSYRHQDSIKASYCVEEAEIFDETFYYINSDKQLYRNSVMRDTKKVLEHNKMIAQEVMGCCADPSGECITFSSSLGNNVCICEAGRKPIEVVADVDTFDCVAYINNMLYEKKLTLSDVAGIYKITELEMAFRLDSDGNMTVYNKGRETENFVVTAYDADKYSMRLRTDKADSILSKGEYSFVRKTDGSTALCVGNIQYSLIGLNESSLTEELVRQQEIEKEHEAQRQEDERIRAEKARREAEAVKHREEAATRAKQYVSYGAYISTGQELYWDHDYSSPTGRYFTRASTHDVYDYYISDTFVVWVKVYSSGGTNSAAGYRWVPMY